MNARPDVLPISIETYLQLESEAEYKSEYVDGVMVAMAGASEEHGQIISNFVHYLRPFADRQRCRVIPNDLRVRARATRYYYPDVVVVCGRATYDEFDVTERGQPRKVRAITNPRIVIEVLSETTERRDLREKKLTYLQNPTITDIIFVAQDELYVEHVYRTSEGRWETALYNSLQDSLILTGLTGTISLEQIYHFVFQLDDDDATA